MRLPPREVRLIARGYSLGHGLLARAAILASSVIFDEVHLFIEEGGKMASAFSALLRWLGAFSTPVCVMSATLPRPIETFLKAELGSGGKISVFKYGEDFRDKEFEAQRLQAAEGLRTRRPRKGDIDVVVKEAIEAYESYEKVLVVLNTVADCIKAAKAINSGGYNSVILHGRLVNSQRSERLKALRGRRWLAVCTQVVEAGVDISALYTITDAAPPCALVQRVGRTLRSKEDVCREGVISIILDEGAFANGTYKGIYDASLVSASFEYLLEHYGDMMWHLPKYPDRPGYEDFIGACYDRANFEVVIDRPLARELTSLLRGMVIMGRILSTLESLGGSFVRDEPLVLGFVNHLGLKEGDEIDNESQRKLREWQLPLSARDVFYVWGHETLAIALEFRSGKYLVKRERIRSTKELIRKLLSGRIYGILIPPEIYDEKLGLIIGRGG